MGRGQIISGGSAGQYQVKLIYAYRSRIEGKITKAQQNITAIEAQIVEVEAKILAESDPKKKSDLVIQKSVLNLQIASLNKQIQYYQTKMPADPTVAAWCADLTEDLTGNVGTVEIPGEPVTVMVRPGYSGRAVYSAVRDGQLMPAVAGEPNQVLFNWMILPGWQRHKPIYRAGTIAPDSIDFSANTCSVCLDAAYSSQLSLPAIDGGTITNCEMGDDAQSQYLTNAGEDFCSRNPGHPFCVGGIGSEINLTDAMLAQLQETNYYVNGAFGRQADQSGKRVGDSWDLMVTPNVDKGDCEDFALTKMDRLVNVHGWNPDNLKLVTAYAANGEYHAMLGVRTTNRGLVILDNNNDEVMESGRVPYRLDKIALASDSWANYSRRLDAVPIEYMQCNAGAFADGDRVVVQFTNQRWTEPKVIGFLTNPKSCTDDKFCLMGGFIISTYEIESNAWAYFGIPSVGEVYSAGAASGGYGYIMGGYDFYSESQAGLKNAYRINAASESAAGLIDMPSGKVRAAGGSSGTKVYCCSGSNIAFSGIYLNSNFEYDTAALSWATRQEIPTGRWDCRGFTTGGCPVYAGGYSGGVPIASVSKYNPISDSFSSIAQMIAEKRGDAQCGDGTNGFSFGGNGLFGPTYAAEKFNGDNGSWGSIKSMPYDSKWYFNTSDRPGSFSVQYNKAFIWRAGRDKWNSNTGVKSRYLNSYDVDGDSYSYHEANNRDENDIASVAGQSYGPSWML